MVQLAVVFTVAVLAGALLTPLVIRMADMWAIYDAPLGDRRVHTEPLPRLGGVAIFAAAGLGLLASGLASLGGLVAWSGSAELFFGVLFGGGIVFATGLLDDVRGLRPITKFAAQLTGALVVYSYGFRLESLTLGSFDLHLGVLALPVTLLWIVGVTNAFNLIDGLDGLATGVALVGLATTLVVALALGNPEVVLVCAALLGALVGFLRYNFNPAQIFLGDSGSLFIGFMLAVLSMRGATEASGSALVVVPIFALAVPLLDTSLSILRRWLRGVPLSQADGRHIHHQLLALGLMHRHAVVVLHISAAVLAALGLSLVFAPAPAIVSVAAAGGGVTLLLLLYGLRRLQYHEFIEAGSVLGSALIRVRRVIRAQIYAQDLAHMVRRADSVEEIGAILEEHASTFGFLRMEICPESAAGSRPLVILDGHASRAWKLDYPITRHDFESGEDQVLRIWCNPQRRSRLYGAERVAQILAPTIEERMLLIAPELGGTGPRVLRGDDGGHADDAREIPIGSQVFRNRSASRALEKR